MTTKQDYIGSILQSLAAITLSNPSDEFLSKVDHTLYNLHCEIDPEGRNYTMSVEDAKEIIADFLDENS